MRIITQGIENYISEKDKLYEWGIGKTVLAITTKKICSITKAENFTYKEIPIERLKYAENKFSGRRWPLLILGILLLITSIALDIFFYPYPIAPIPIIISIPVIVLAIWLILKGLKRKGALIINNKDWKISYKGIEDIDNVQEFLKVVHYVPNGLDENN